MGWLAERHAMQRVSARPGRQRADDGIGQHPDWPVEHVSAFDAFGDGGRPRREAGLARPADLAMPSTRRNGGLPHTWLRTRNWPPPTMNSV
jgi:hypothetical protein